MFGDDVKRLSKRLVLKYPHMWKVALWGTPRDLALINDLRERFPSLSMVAEQHGWLIREGVSLNGSDANYAPELAEMRFVPVNTVQPFRVTADPKQRIGGEIFHRPGNPLIYKGPHVLIRGGPLSRGFLAAAFLPDDAVFKNGIIGVAGPPEETDYLKVMCAYFNSSLARYYQFLTAGTWGVERDVVRKFEYTNLPCALPLEDDGLLNEIVALVDHASISAISPDLNRVIDDLVFKAYGLTPAERQTVEDTIAYTMCQHLSIECKRVALSDLARLYVKHGMKRFVRGFYGPEANKGGMVGYIISDTAASVVRRVNDYVERDPGLGTGHKLVSSNAVGWLNDVYTSNHARPSPFLPIRLTHLLFNLTHLPPA